MAGSVVSLVRRPPLALRGADPVLEVNAWALAEAVELSVVLAGEAVELAVATEVTPGSDLVGVALPVPAARDLRALLESGVPVYVDREAADRHGLGVSDLVDGVRLIGSGQLQRILADADAVLTW